MSGFKRLERIVVLFIIACIFLIGMVSAQENMWQKIRNAGGTDDYPKSDWVLIFDSTRVDVKDSGLSYVHFHRLYKVLTTRGALDLRVIRIDYDPLSAYVDIEGVRVYKKDGTIIDLDLRNIQDYPAPARAIYWGAREKMLEVGRLEPGDAVKVFLFRKGFTYALLTGQDEDERYIPPMRGHFYDIVEFWSQQPVLEKVYQVRLPKDKPLQYEFYNGEVRSSVQFKGAHTLYTFVKTQIMPFKTEPDMVALSDEAPKLLLSTSPDWYAKAQWFYGVNEDYGSFEYTDELKQKVDEILQGVKGEDEKIARLTHWVADEIRYSGLSMGPGEGYTLHKAEMTFLDRCGVCKDKAGILVAMLRAAGFESYAAMTMAGSRIDYIPADQFNHSVTVVKKSDGKFHLLDPTWVPFVRELWSSAEQQQEYLMGLPQGSDLATTPISPPENHYYRIQGKSELLNDGTLKGQLTIEAEGQSDAGFRRMFVRTYKIQWRSFLESEFLKLFPAIEFERIDFGDPYDYSNPIQIMVSYRIPDFARITRDEIVFRPLVAANLFNHPFLNDHLFKNTSLEERSYQFRSRCSKLIELSEEIKLPTFKKLVYQPQVDTVKGSGADYEGGYSLKGRTLQMKQRVVLKKRIYDPDDWPSYRAAILAQKKLADEPVIFQR